MLVCLLLLPLGLGLLVSTAAVANALLGPILPSFWGRWILLGFGLFWLPSQWVDQRLERSRPNAPFSVFLSQTSLLWIVLSLLFSAGFHFGAGVPLQAFQDEPLRLGRKLKDKVLGASISSPASASTSTSTSNPTSVAAPASGLATGSPNLAGLDPEAEPETIPSSNFPEENASSPLPEIPSGGIDWKSLGDPSRPTEEAASPTSSSPPDSPALPESATESPEPEDSTSEETTLEFDPEEKTPLDPLEADPQVGAALPGLDPEPEEIPEADPLASDPPRATSPQEPSRPERDAPRLSENPLAAESQVQSSNGEGGDTVLLFPGQEGYQDPYASLGGEEGGTLTLPYLPTFQFPKVDLKRTDPSRRRAGEEEADWFRRKQAQMAKLFPELDRSLLVRWIVDHDRFRQKPSRMEEAKTQKPWDQIPPLRVYLRAQLLVQGKTEIRAKFEALHDWIVEEISFDLPLREKPDSNFWLRQTPAQVLKDRRATPVGYAQLFHAFCRCLRLPERIVFGVTRRQDETWSEALARAMKQGGGKLAPNHAWNEVKIGNQLLPLDLSWDTYRKWDGVQHRMGATRRDWFLPKPKVFESRHKKLKPPRIEGGL